MFHLTDRFTRSSGLAGCTALASLALLVSCHVDVSRVRNGVPLNLEAYESLEEGKSSLDDALERLGAPDRVLARDDRNFLQYFHQDFVRVGVRFQSPLSIFGYRHTIADLEGNSDDTNSLALVFDDRGVLRQKSLRLSHAYARLAEEEEETGWAVYLLPEYAYSPVYLGDGGEEDFNDLFRDGHKFGVHVGILPAPFFMILAGGNYQRHRGDRFDERRRRISLDDLELWQLEVGGRLQFPPEFFTLFWNFDEVRALLYSDDVRRHQGPFFYLKWALSGTYNEDLDVDVDGASAGTYFDRSLRASSTLGAGFEYVRDRFGVHVEVLYQTIGAFEDGDVEGASVDTDAGDFQNIFIGGGLSFRF